jgi:hypothetical protein
MTEVTPNLYQVNPGTGAVTLLGPITGLVAGDGPNGIGYNSANGTYYLVGSANFYSFNVTTRVATLIGPFNIAGGLMIDLCFNQAGTCYAYDLGVDNAYTINIATGAPTLLGTLGYDANFGQGMDYDYETNTIYLSAFNNGTFTGQLRTMNATTGMTTLIVDWGFDQVAPFALDTQAGPPCPVGAPSNPTPANGATNVAITGTMLMWTNGSGTTQIEVWFGPVGNVTMIYSGAPVTSRDPGALNYATTYQWYVRCGNGSCFTQGPSWSFTTMDDPNLGIDEFYCTDFTAGVGDFTITNEGGTCVWQQLTTTSNVYTLPATAQGNILGADSDLCGSGTTLLSTARLTNALNFAGQSYFYIEIKFDNDWRIINAADEAHVELSTNGGSTWTSVWSRVGVDQRNSTEVIDVTTYAGQASVQVRFRTVQPGWDWWWAIDNLCISGHFIIPVELTSFTAAALGSNVELNWTTATETNNQGFHIERSNGGEFESVGFVAGHGTTTEIQNYNFVDRNVEVGNYSYRLKQIDYDGTYEYSDVVEVEVIAPAEFSLEQNYPNPFNPSTKISFRLAADSRVSLKVFDVLGQEVMTLVNNELVAGVYDVDFNASGLNSGVYFYKLEASGNGVQFSDVKKMILTK